jgi:hypothetical protein
MVATSPQGNHARLAVVRWLLLTVMLLAIGLPLPLTILVRYVAADWIRNSVSPPLIEKADAPIRSPLRLATWWSGEVQRRFEPWFASILAPRGWTVRMTNQIYYSAFGRSYMDRSDIIVGRDQYLYGRNYLYWYCEADRFPMTEHVTPFIVKLRELQYRLARRDRLLLFLLTPSKAVTMPEFLPARLCARPTAPDRAHKLLVALLRQAGIPVIDGPDLVLAMKAHDPLPPFPRGSVHWSRLAGSRVAAVFMDEILRLSGADLGSIAQRDPQWNHPPIGSDSDLADLLNLFWPPLDYPTGEAESICRSTASGQSTTLIAVGGSFLTAVIEPLVACNLFKRVDMYFYYTLGHTRWPGGSEPVDRVTLKWREMLDQANVIMVEVNESMIGYVPHLDQFLDDAIAALR